MAYPSEAEVPASVRVEPNAPAILFPSDPVQRELQDWLTRQLTLARANVRNGSVAPITNRDAIAADLERFDFESPEEIRDVLGWTLQHMSQAIVQITHPRYFGLYNPAPTQPAVCAERIVSQFNAQLASATTSPFPVLLEAHLIRAIAARAGMPSHATGHFTSGGSEANATAVICALTRASPSFGKDGVRSFAAAPTIYASAEAHLAWIKIAHQTGIGRNAVRLVPTDGHGRMDSAALEKMLKQDRAAGCLPVMIVSTAGTTGAGMIDPIRDCSRLAQLFGAWHHVDAAWAGALLFSERHAPLDGISEADSITIDAHKWLATSMGCGMFFTAHPSVLQESFRVAMDCMPSNDPGIDPYLTTLQWSRRFLGLRLFLALATAGWRGYADYLERSIHLASVLAQKLEQIGWVCVNTSPCAVLCLRPPPGAADASTIVRATVASGRAWISSVVFEGEAVVRACITNGRTTEADLLELVAVLNHFAWLDVSGPAQITAVAVSR